jgi:flagellar basal body-associated protein FliL
VNQSSEFCRHNPLYCFSTSVYIIIIIIIIIVVVVVVVVVVVYFVIDSVRKILDTPSFVFLICFPSLSLLCLLCEFTYNTNRVRTISSKSVI